MSKSQSQSPCASQCGERKGNDQNQISHSPIERGHKILKEVKEEHDPDYFVVALSGGHDSSTALHFALSSPDIDVDQAVHMDTGIGLQMTTDYVEEVCNRWGVDLFVLNDDNARYPHESYEFLIKLFGFPGAHRTAHSGMWKNLKNKVRERYESTFDGTVAFISGVRKAESEDRYESIPNSGYGIVNGTLWVSPLIDFTDSDLNQYRDQHNIPRNEAYDIIHASGECLCGSFEDRHNLPWIHAIEPETARKIWRLEFDVLDLVARGEIKKEYALWANGSLDPGEYEARTGDQTGLTCTQCENRCPNDPYQVTGKPLSPAERFLKENDLSDYWNRTFYCAPCDEVVDDPYTHRQEVHPFDAEEGLAAQWDMRMIDVAATYDYGEPITEPNGWNLHVNQLTTNKGEAAIRKHRYYYEDYSLTHCDDHDHSWALYNNGPTLVCEDCGAFNLRDYDMANPGPPVFTPEPTKKPAFIETEEDQYSLENFI